MPRTPKHPDTDKFVRIAEEAHDLLGEVVHDLRLDGGRKEALSLLVAYASTPEGKAALTRFKRASSPSTRRESEGVYIDPRQVVLSLHPSPPKAETKVAVAPKEVQSTVTDVELDDLLDGLLSP